MFRIGNDIWTIKFVSPINSNLVDRTGNLTLATTSPNDKIIFMSNAIPECEFRQVLLHELMHVVMYEFGINNDISRMVKPEYRIDMEEYICNICSQYHDLIESTSFVLYSYT